MRPCTSVLLSLLPLQVAAAQWSVGVEVGTVQFHGTSRDTSASASGAYLRPDHAATYGVRLTRSLGRFHLSLRGSTAKPGIAAAATRISLTDRTTGRLYEAALAAGIRIATVGSGGVARLEAAPVLQWWNIGGEERSRLAGLGAFAYEWSVVGRLTGTLRVEGTIGSSVFEAAELPPELERRSTWGHGVSLELRYRL